MSSSTTTTKLEDIRKWAEARDGKPSKVKNAGGKKSGGIIRINFPGNSGEDSL